MADPIDYLRSIKPVGAILLASRDADLQAALACWPFLIFRRKRRAHSRAHYARASEAIADLWAGVEVDVERSEDLVASPDALYAVKRVAALGLAFPDGTLHPAAQALLARMLSAETTAPAVGRRRRNPS